MCVLFSTKNKNIIRTLLQGAEADERVLEMHTTRFVYLAHCWPTAPTESLLIDGLAYW